MGNLAEFQFFYIAQEKHCSLFLGQVLDNLPDLPQLFAGCYLLLGRTLIGWQSLAGLTHVHRVLRYLAPELKTPVPPVVLLKVDGNSNQPSPNARITSKAQPVSLRFQETLLSQCLGQFHIAQ